MEASEILDYLGLKDVKDVAEFKSKFNEKHISREMATSDPEIKASITGATYGSIFQEAKRTFKEIGVEFEDGEVPKNDVKKLFEVGKTKVSTRLEELTKAAPDVEKWQKEIEKKDKKLNDLSTLFESTKTRLAEVEAEKTTAVKGVKLDIAKKEIYGQIKFSETVRPLERDGFDTKINKLCKLDMEDETGSAIILDAKTNQRIQSPAKASEFATPIEILTIEAEKEGLLAKANQKSVNLQTQQRQQFTLDTNSDGIVRNKIKPANAKG